mmetsp:Transcript_9176/g.11464  ORF Transcript_9176/g.11464 Transcript_9176/m.11464 type:complete len:497 (-) Transcript_9176:69-1559(-)
MENQNYKPVNFLAFNFAGFACIALVVFLSSTQPFFLDLVVRVDSKKIGNIIGTLGFIDELTSVVTSPLIGTLCDKMNNMVNGSGMRMVGGTRAIEFGGFGLIGLSLIGYAKMGSSVDWLYLWRPIFAVGVTGCMSMVTVMLNELSNSDFKLAFWKKQNEAVEHEFEENEMLEPDGSHTVGEVPVWEDGNKKHGRYAAFIGISTGLGAIFSVSFFLPMPSKLSDSFSIPIKEGLQLSYLILGFVAIAVGSILLVTLYDSTRHNNPMPHTNKAGYFQLLREGVLASKGNIRIQLAYLGSFVARSTTVAMSVFIPLLVYNFYYKNGICGSDGDDTPSKQSCRDGYVFAAILTGVAQTVALCSAPLWAWLIDHPLIGSTKSLFISSFLGIIGCFGLCIMGSKSDIYDPRTAGSFIVVSFIGLSQTGVIITSMSFISSLKKTGDSADTIGSISGLYSLCGGLGILIITKVGGLWSDHWILGPFFVLGLFNLILTVVSAIGL